MNLIAKKFEELDIAELYEILKARTEIFIMEQNIHYQDMDNVGVRIDIWTHLMRGCIIELCTLH